METLGLRSVLLMCTFWSLYLGNMFPVKTISKIPGNRMRWLVTLVFILLGLGSTYMLIDCTQCKENAYNFSNFAGSCQCYGLLTIHLCLLVLLLFTYQVIWGKEENLAAPLKRSWSFTLAKLLIRLVQLIFSIFIWTLASLSVLGVVGHSALLHFSLVPEGENEEGGAFMTPEVAESFLYLSLVAMNTWAHHTKYHSAASNVVEGGGEDADGEDVTVNHVRGSLFKKAKATMKTLYEGIVGAHSKWRMVKIIILEIVDTALQLISLWSKQTTTPSIANSLAMSISVLSCCVTLLVIPNSKLTSRFPWTVDLVLAFEAVTDCWFVGYYLTVFQYTSGESAFFDYLSPALVGDLLEFTIAIATSKDTLGTFITIASLIRLNQFLFSFDHALNASYELEAPLDGKNMVVEGEEALPAVPIRARRRASAVSILLPHHTRRQSLVLGQVPAINRGAAGGPAGVDDEDEEEKKVDSDDSSLRLEEASPLIHAAEQPEHNTVFRVVCYIGCFTGLCFIAYLYCVTTAGEAMCNSQWGETGSWCANPNYFQDGLFASHRCACFVVKAPDCRNGENTAIPSDIATTFPAVKIWSTQKCNITGSIPADIGEMRQLEYVYITYNPELSSTIPGSITQLEKLRLLNLGDNNLTGSIPEDIGKMTSLHSIYLTNNHISGSIPASIGGLVKLKVLVLYINDLSGEIPESVGSLTSLFGISLDNNSLSGSIPEEMCKLGKLSFLMLGYNNITGGIPSCIGDMHGLGQLHLPGNQLEGEIPPSFELLERLFVVNLADNRLSGEIPDAMWRTNGHVLLANNDFEGTLSVDMSSSEMLSLTLNGNTRLTGTVTVAADFDVDYEYSVVEIDRTEERWTSLDVTGTSITVEYAETSGDA